MNSPAPGEALIPRTTGWVRVFFSQSGYQPFVAFGNVPAAPTLAAKPAAAVERNRWPAAPAPSGASKPASGPAPEKRYTVTFSVNIQNRLNTTNLAQPIGNLSSPQLGEAISTAGGFGFLDQAAVPRLVTVVFKVQIRFGF